MKKEKSCGAIVIDSGKILLVKHNKGHYGFPKGHVEPGENEVETAIREVKEETNVDIEITSPKRYLNTYMPKENTTKDVIFFLARPLNGKTKPQESEIKEVLWVPIDKVPEYLEFENIIKIWQDEIIKDIEKNSLFIYYSISGNGDMVADYLKKNNVTIRKIKPIKPLPKNMFFRIIVGGYLAGKDYQDELVDFDSDISQYKKIIIGSPIWRDRLSTPINTVLSKLDLRDKELIFILYSGSGYAAKATEKINKLYPKAKIIHLKEPLKYQEVLVDKLKNI